MKLKEFSITRYGPLRSTGKISLGDFNLLWGKNEDGKTLTIDALVKLLVGRNVKDFRDIDRVDERPEGYVVLEDDRGKEIKLPEKGDLAKVAGLSSLECRNIFVIRNSDLSVASEGEFYARVTDKLTGLRTEEISKAKDALREIAKITPAGSFRNVGEEKLKARIEKAKELVEKIDNIADKAVQEGFDELEQEALELEEKIERLKQDLQNLEDARKREKYEKGKEALEELVGALQRKSDLVTYNEADRQAWRDCGEDIKRYTEQKKVYLEDLRKKEEELGKTTEKLREAERECGILQDRKRKLDELNSQLMSYEMEFGKVTSEETRSRFYTAGAIASTVLLSIAILAMAVSQLPIFYSLIALFLAAAIVFGVLRFLFTQRKAHLAGVFERMRLAASSFQLGAGNAKELYLNIQRFDEEYQRQFEVLQTIKTKRAELEQQIMMLRDKELPGLERKIQDAERKIGEIRAKSNVDTLTEYAERLASKNDVDKLIQTQASVLRSHFGDDGKRLEENIRYWSDELQKLERYKDKAEGVKYSEAAVSKLHEAERETEATLDSLRKKLGAVREELREVGREATDIVKFEEPLYCDTSVDLKVIQDRLRSFIEENEGTRQDVLKAIEIFEEIQREEKAKVSELFGTESPVSRYFSEITAGLYREVLFDQETGKVQVKRVDGSTLVAEKLSGGAYDQLYLCIRLALGEKLLKTGKGFFIMDDPFVKADPDRLERQMEVLKRVSGLGWQIIYFSAKAEVREALKQGISEGTVAYIEVQGLMS